MWRPSSTRPLRLFGISIFASQKGTLSISYKESFIFQNCWMFGGIRDLLVGKPLRIVSIRVTHSASETAASFMSSQVTAGTCLAWKDAQTLVEDSSMRGLDESVSGYLDVKSGL